MAEQSVQTSQPTELDRAKVEIERLRTEIRSQSAVKTHAQTIPQRKTYTRKRPALWISLLFTGLFLPIVAPGWVFNGILSVEGLSTSWTIIVGSEPPDVLAWTFDQIGWGIVIASTVLELALFFCWLTRRTPPAVLLRAALAFGGYDILTTMVGLYFRWQPTGTWWLGWLIGSIIVTYGVEFLLSLFWKEY